MLLLLACGMLVVAGADPKDRKAIDAMKTDGGTTTLFTNQVVRGTILVFVATECPIANRYAPVLEQLRKPHAGTFDFWIVYPGDESSTRVKEHQQEYWPGFKGLLDRDFKLTDLAQAKRTPQAALFNAAGELVYTGRVDDRAADFGKWRLEPTERNLERALRALSTNQNIRLPSVPAVGCSIPR